MLSTSELLTAAKRGAGIPSNYRLARVLGLSDNTLTRWNGGAIPDDAHAARLARMAGLDVEFVVVCMKALREKDPALREIWLNVARRLENAPQLPPEGSDHGPDDSGPDFGHSGPGLSGSDGALHSAGRDMGSLCVMSSQARMARIVRASLGRALKKKSSH